MSALPLPEVADQIGHSVHALRKIRERHREIFPSPIGRRAHVPLYDPIEIEMFLRTCTFVLRRGRPPKVETLS